MAEEIRREGLAVHERRPRTGRLYRWRHRYDGLITTEGPGMTRRNVALRGVNIVLGAWLFLSAWLWPHTSIAQANTWLCGLFIFTLATLAVTVPNARFLNAAVGAWLLVSTVFWVGHHSTATAIHNLVIGLVVFAVSLVPAERGLVRHEDMALRRHVV